MQEILIEKISGRLGKFSAKPANSCKNSLAESSQFQSWVYHLSLFFWIAWEISEVFHSKSEILIILLLIIDKSGYLRVKSCEWRFNWSRVLVLFYAHYFWMIFHYRLQGFWRFPRFIYAVSLSKGFNFNCFQVWKKFYIGFIDISFWGLEYFFQGLQNRFSNPQLSLAVINLHKN